MDALKLKTDERNGYAAKVRQLADKVKTQDDGFTDDQRKEFDEYREKIEAIDVDIKNLRSDADNAAFLARLDQDNEKRDRDDFEFKKTGEITATQRSQAFMSQLMRTKNQQLDEMTQRVIKESGSFKFGKDGDAAQVLHSQAPKSITEARKLSFESCQRAQSVGTTTAGGFTVPDEMMREVEIALLKYGGIRQVATVMRTATGADLPIPTVNDTSNKGELLSENTQTNEQDVSFGQVVLQAFKYSSKAVRVSIELMQDSMVNMPQFLGRALGERLGRIENEHFTTGDASSKPNGIVTAAANSSVTTASNTALTRSELVDIMKSVDPAYQADGAWMFNDTILKLILKITDDTNQPLWLPGLDGPIGDTVLSRPYVVNQDMVSTASGKAILFGDFSKYHVRDVADMNFLQLSERWADYGQVGFLAFMRCDGDLIDAGTNPVKYATLAA